MTESKPPIFSIFCIDYRFDAMLAEFYKNTGLEFNYFACSTAGAGLCLGYKEYCQTQCQSCGCQPNNISMKILKRSVVENLNIALTLKDIKNIYIVNHQDCGAIRAFLECSGYPDHGEHNRKEIKINSILLTYAVKYMKKTFNMKYTLGLMDINGTVAFFDIKTKIWKVEYLGEFNDKKGLWYGMSVGETYKV